MPLYCPSLTITDLNATNCYTALCQQNDFSTDLLADACIQAHLLSVPKGIWHLYTYDQDEHTILANKPLLLTNPHLIHQLTGAVEVAILAATIGLPLEQEVSNLFIQKQSTLGMLLDAAGTMAIEATCNAVCAVISQQAAQTGRTTGSRISPGHGDCPVELQPNLLELSTGTTLDLSLTDTKMLVPRKSVTAIIGLYPYHHAINLSHQQELIRDKCGQTDCQARKEK